MANKKVFSLGKSKRNIINTIVPTDLIHLNNLCRNYLNILSNLYIRYRYITSFLIFCWLARCNRVGRANWVTPIIFFFSSLYSNYIIYILPSVMRYNIYSLEIYAYLLQIKYCFTTITFSVTNASLALYSLLLFCYSRTFVREEYLITMIVATAPFFAYSTET